MRLVSDLYGAGIERMVVLAREHSPELLHAPGRRRAGRRSARAPRRAPREPARQGRGCAGVGATDAPGPRGRRRAARHRRGGGRGPAPPAGQLRRLPVVGGHPPGRGRAGHLRRRPRDRHHRRGRARAADRSRPIRADRAGAQARPTRRAPPSCPCPRRPAHERRGGPAGGDRPHPRAAGAAAPAPRRALRDVRRGGTRRARSRRRPGGPHAHVHLSGLLPAVQLDGGGRRALPGGRGSLPRLPRARAHARPVGRAADPGQRRLLLRELDHRPGLRVLPEPGWCHRVAPVARHVERGGRREPHARHAGARRRGVPRPHRWTERDGPSATWSRSTGATSSSARCGSCGAASTAARTCTEALDAFFAEVADRAVVP